MAWGGAAWGNQTGRASGSASPGTCCVCHSVPLPPRAAAGRAWQTGCSRQSTAGRLQETEHGGQAAGNMEVDDLCTACCRAWHCRKKVQGSGLALQGSDTRTHPGTAPLRRGSERSRDPGCAQGCQSTAAQPPQAGTCGPTGRGAGTEEAGAQGRQNDSRSSRGRVEGSVGRAGARARPTGATMAAGFPVSRPR